MTTEDGGSAFPRKASESRNGTMVTRIEGSRGLSKREWFAGQALPAVMKDMPNVSKVNLPRFDHRPEKSFRA